MKSLHLLNVTEQCHLDLAAIATSIYEITYVFLGFVQSYSHKYECQAKLL